MVARNRCISGEKLLAKAATLSAEKNQISIPSNQYMSILKGHWKQDMIQPNVVQGVRDSTTKSHNTSTLCMKEIKKCLDMSLGPAFICFVGNKYGYRPFPALIEKHTLDSMWSYLCEHHVTSTSQLEKDLRDVLEINGKKPVCDVNWDTTTCSRLKPLSFIPQCFKLDENWNPPQYVLQISQC